MHNTVAVLVDFFRFSNIQYKMVTSFFLIVVSATFLISSHRILLSNSFRLCKLKKIGLKFVSQNVP